MNFSTFFSSSYISSENFAFQIFFKEMSDLMKISLQKQNGFGFYSIVGKISKRLEWRIRRKMEKSLNFNFIDK